MDTNSYKIYDLEQHETKDTVNGHVNGLLTVIWRDWDNHQQQLPKMVYITSVKPNEKKGPHLHTERNSLFSCIQGEIIFVIRDNSGKYHEVKMSETKPQIILIPKGIASAHANIGNTEGKILALADISWKPGNKEMKNVTFDDYSWEKWINS